MTHECFEKIKDIYTKKDIVEQLMFNRDSDLTCVNFKGFCVIVIQNGDNMISVAIMGIQKYVVEVPVIATRFRYQQQGTCRILMNELEMQLWKMGVKKLILPSALNMVDIWVTSFGFLRMIESEE